MSLGSIVKIAADLRDEMRAHGADQAELDAATERIVRANWPSIREWRYLCQRCGDYGLEMFDCPGDASCGRDKQHLPHQYGRPCWCSAGAKLRPTPKADEDFEQAGKVTKPKTFSRFGR
jgi:hypothetical protein